MRRLGNQRGSYGGDTPADVRPRVRGVRKEQPALGDSAFTLLEMLTTVAALVILLGLMVSLARYVRSRSAEQMTRQLLKDLEVLMDGNPDVQPLLAAVPPLVKDPKGKLADDVLQMAALENNKQFVAVWKEAGKDKAFKDQPLSVYDEVTLRDPWGTPIVYMAPHSANIGIAPQNRRFFLSAGPDRSFITLVDNLYSYERAW